MNISYLGPPSALSNCSQSSLKLYQDLQLRRCYLQNSYGFYCQCSMCLAESGESNMVEMNESQVICDVESQKTKKNHIQVGKGLAEWRKTRGTFFMKETR